MKNIHLLPTEKPSRLYKDGEKLKLDIESYGVNNQNIYITSDEEIKEGVNQWYLDKFLNKPYNSGGSQYSSKQDVIILTTDQDLIKDGVQAIDDEFLEWFVKNPSCEEVETTRDFADEGIKGITYYGKYFIIIPKEEPKQETLNKINNMNEEIKKQINLLEEEQTRVKQFINENNFNCTTAPYVIAKQYRDEIKKHIGILKMNLEN
jgi:hypothetical protein